MRKMRARKDEIEVLCTKVKENGDTNYNLIEGGEMIFKNIYTPACFNWCT